MSYLIVKLLRSTCNLHIITLVMGSLNNHQNIICMLCEHAVYTSSCLLLFIFFFKYIIEIKNNWELEKKDYRKESLSM